MSLGPKVDSGGDSSVAYVIDSLGRKLYHPPEWKNSWISSKQSMSYQMDSPEKEAKGVLLFLHGFAQSSIFMRKKFISEIKKRKLDTDYTLLWPNGPIPLMGKKELRFAWYLFDSETKTYLTPPENSIQLIQGLVNELKLDKLPLWIVGYSQGGYLAPFLAYHLENAEKVVGISAEFKEEYLPERLDFKLDAVHGRLDEVVSCERSRISHQKIIQNKNQGHYTILENEGHSLSPSLISSALDFIS